MNFSPFFLQFTIIIIIFFFSFSFMLGSFLLFLARSIDFTKSRFKSTLHIPTKTSSLCASSWMESKKINIHTLPLHPLKTHTHYSLTVSSFFLNLEFVICSLQILKKHGIFSFCVGKKPPYVPSLTPRPPYFLARVVNAWESNVQLVYSSITSLFLLSPFLPARWYPRTIFYDLFKKKSWKSEGEVGGRKGERERVSEPRATVYRQTSRPNNQQKD